MEYYLATFAICNNVNGPREDYAKRNKSEKDKYCMISLICGIYKTNQMNKHNKTEAESQIWGTNRWLPEGRGWGVGEK